MAAENSRTLPRCQFHTQFHIAYYK